MQRTDRLNVQGLCLREQLLRLRAILSDDAEIVSSRLARPILVGVERAELAEAVGGKEDLVVGIIGHDDLGPVHHRGCDKGQGVLAEREGVAVLYHNAALGIIVAEELLHHHEGAVGRHDSQRGVGVHQARDIGRVVGLHMLYDKIIGRTLTEHRLDICKPLLAKASIDRIHHSNLFVKDNVRIICHSVGNGVLPLKEVDVVVVDANVANIIRNVHKITPWISN